MKGQKCILCSITQRGLSNYINVPMCLFDQFSSIQKLSHVQLPWTAAPQSSLSITNSWSLLKLMSIESLMPTNYLIFSCPLLLPPSMFASIRWPKYWSFRFSISPSNEYSGLISFRMDLLDLPVGQGTLKSLLQHHSSKASFFSAQFSL